MAASTTTPDGFKVGAAGAVIVNSFGGIMHGWFRAEK